MIQVEGLTKKYGDHTAVSDLSFHVEKGQIYGFLGPNGAGKTTTMNILTGCLAATSGSVSIGGHDIFEDATEAKRLMGYLPEQPPLYPDRTPYEYLTFVAQAKGVSRTDEAAQIARVMEETGIAEVQNRLIRNLSKGYKQRVGLAQALIGNPQIIILDEPTVGLDPQQIIEIRELIKTLGEERTVILSSHILSEVQAICNVILIISKGKLVACDTAENLERHFTGTVTVELTVEAGKMESDKALRAIGKIAELTFVGKKNGRCEYEILSNEDESICRDIFFAFSEIGKPILQMKTTRASLEDIFIELTRDEASAADTEDGMAEEDIAEYGMAEEYDMAEDGIVEDGIAEKYDMAEYEENGEPPEITDYKGADYKDEGTGEA